MRYLAQLIRQAIDWFYLPVFRRVMPLQTFRYATVGAANLGLSLVLYAVLYNFVLDKEIVRLPFVAISPYIAALLIVFPVTFFTGFWLNRNVAFRGSPLRGRVQLFRYLLSVSGSLVVNYLCLKFFVELLGFYPTPSQALTQVITVMYSYLAQKHFTFRGAAPIAHAGRDKRCR